MPLAGQQPRPRLWVPFPKAVSMWPMSPQTIKNPKSTSSEVCQEKPPSWPSLSPLHFPSRQLLENRAGENESQCQILTRQRRMAAPRGPHPQAWHGGLGAGPLSRCCGRSVYFALHKGKPGPPLTLGAGEGGGERKSPGFKLKTRSTSLKLLVLFLWLLNGPHCAGQACTLHLWQSGPEPLNKCH